MVRDCEYAEKNNGMDEDMQLACEAEKLTLDHSSSLVREAEMLAPNDTFVIQQRSLRTNTNQFNYKNCCCFWVTHIQDLCDLCIRGCWWEATEKKTEKKRSKRKKMSKVREEHEKRRKMREKVFAERLAKDTEDQKVVAT